MQQRTGRHDRSQSHDLYHQSPPLLESDDPNGQASYESHSGSSHTAIGGQGMTHAASFPTMAHSQDFTSFSEPFGIQEINSLMNMNQMPAPRAFIDRTIIQPPQHSRANSDSAIYSIIASSYSPEMQQGISSVLSGPSPSSSSPHAPPSRFDAHRCSSCVARNWTEVQSPPSHVLVGAAQALQPYAQSNVISPSFNEPWNDSQAENTPQYVNYIPYSGDLYYYPSGSGQDLQEVAAGLENIEGISSFQPFMTHLYPYGHAPFTSPPFSLSPSISPPLQPSSSRAPSMTPPTMYLPLSRTTTSFSAAALHVPPHTWPSRDLSASPSSSVARSGVGASSMSALFDPKIADMPHRRPTPPSDGCCMQAGSGCHTGHGCLPQEEMSPLPKDDEKFTVEQTLIANVSHTVSLPGNPAATPEEVTAFVNASFPTGTPNYRALRVALRAVIYSKWKENDELEPTAHYLRQFVAFSRNEGRVGSSSNSSTGHVRGESSEMRIRRTRWECLFYVMGNQGESIKCRCSSTRSIQALEHVRRHIKLEPYVCQGEPCPEGPEGCGARYSSMDPLRKHRKGRAKCQACLREVLPGNMKRHLEVNCHEDDN